jgi:GT2 family glycosyltransferase
VVEAINRHPQACLLYSDEDTLTIERERTEPYFKCDFNYELFLAQDFISPLAVYRRSLLQQVGGLRAEHEAAPLYDLTLRLLEHLGIGYVDPSQITHSIVHIPRVLCHRAPTSKLPKDNAQAVATAQRQALRAHLHRRAIDATISPAPDSPTHHRVRYHLPTVLPLVSIIIPTRDRADLLKTCLDSILQRSSYPNLEIIILDNGSTEPATVQLFSQFPKNQVRILRDDRPFNFSALNNRGASLAQGDFLCLMNNDIEVITPDWLEEMVSFAQHPDIGCVGARLWYPSGFLQHSGIILGMGGVAGHAHLNLRRGDPGYHHRAVLHQNFSAVTAACLVVRRTLFHQVGGFDEALAVAFNDVDLCLRVQQAGFRNVWTPYAEMFHYESASRGYETKPHQQVRLQTEANFMQKRWGDILFNDPAYSPNLGLELHDFSYAFPPRRANSI